MNGPIVRRSPDRTTLANDIADAWVARVAQIQHDNGVADVALTGGKLAEQVNLELARRVPTSAVNPALLELWWTDEPFVATDDPRRNSLRTLGQLAGQFSLDPARTHPMPSSDAFADPVQAAVSYGLELAGRTIDVCLLSVGPDGHVAGLYPNHPAAEPTPAMAVAVMDAPTQPPERITLTLAAINRSREVWLIASGADQAKAVSSALHGDPASIAAHVSGVERTMWFVDQAAAALLPFHHCHL